ncbi:energy transducer TonB [Qipengyuania sp. ASV99]|uniref:energy transducer TonB n=1 Tax=Qipengyuania sp. ASV99 TaxID=3399681 RepID=UPI003A4C7E4F
MPNSDWNIDFGEDYCRLARTFSDREDQYLLYIEQAGPATGFGMTLAGPKIRQFRQVITRLKLEEDEGFPQTDSQRGEVVGFGPAAIFSRIEINDVTETEPEGALRTLPQIDLEEASSITRVQFGHGGYALSFETGDMGPPLQALDVCSADFVRAWGLDVEQHKQFTRLARWTNEQEVAREIQKYYTRSALNRGEQAIIRMRVIVDEDGSVSECKLFESTETERLESKACEEMEDAEFEPALDASGQPMRSFYTTNIIYRITEANAHG